MGLAELHTPAVGSKMLAVFVAVSVPSTVGPKPPTFKTLPLAISTRADVVRPSGMGEIVPSSLLRVKSHEESSGCHTLSVNRYENCEDGGTAFLFTELT